MRSNILTASCVPRVSALCPLCLHCVSTVQEEPCVLSREEPRHWPYLSLAAGDKWRRTQQPLLSLSHSFRICFQGAGVIFSQQSTGSWCHLRDVEAGTSLHHVDLVAGVGWVGQYSGESVADTGVTVTGLVSCTHTPHPDTALPSPRFAHSHRLDITEQINAQNLPHCVITNCKG